MSAKEDDDVDSGWGDDEDEPQSTRAVDSRLLLAQAGFPAVAPAPPPPQEPVPAPPQEPEEPDDNDDEPQSTRAVDSHELLAAAGLMLGDKPAERSRSSEKETMPPPPGPAVAEALLSSRPAGPLTARSSESPRPPSKSTLTPVKQVPGPGVGRRNTPVVSDAPLRARTLDATAKTRTGSPSVVTPVNIPAVAPAGGGSSLRFGSEVELSGKRDRGTKAGPAFRTAPPPEPAAPTESAREPLPTLVEWVDTGSVEVEELTLSAEEEAALSGDLEDLGVDLDVGLETSSGGETLDPALDTVRKHFDRGDFLGASLRAELLLEDRPDFAEARRYLDRSREALHAMYLERLGSGSMILRLAMSSDEIQGLDFDHRAGWLFSLIDGMATIEEILDICGMPQLEALRLLYDMQQQGVVVVDSMHLG